MGDNILNLGSTIEMPASSGDEKASLTNPDREVNHHKKTGTLIHILCNRYFLALLAGAGVATAVYFISTAEGFNACSNLLKDCYDDAERNEDFGCRHLNDTTKKLIKKAVCNHNETIGKDLPEWTGCNMGKLLSCLSTQKTSTKTEAIVAVLAGIVTSLFTCMVRTHYKKCLTASTL